MTSQWEKLNINISVNKQNWNNTLQSRLSFSDPSLWNLRDHLIKAEQKYLYILFKKLTKFNTFNNVSYSWHLEPEPIKEHQHWDTKASDFLPLGWACIPFRCTSVLCSTKESGDSSKWRQSFRAESSLLPELTLLKSRINLKFDRCFTKTWIRTLLSAWQ